MTLKLVFHGGRCCGVKTIYGFPYDPDTDMMCAPLSHKPPNNADKDWGVTSVTTDFFTDEAPQESYRDRLNRLIAFCEKKRPEGVIEVILTDNKAARTEYYSQLRWGPILEEKGFRLVTEANNSNSGNNIFIYHKVSSRT